MSTPHNDATEVAAFDADVEATKQGLEAEQAASALDEIPDAANSTGFGAGESDLQDFGGLEEVDPSDSTSEP